MSYQSGEEVVERHVPLVALATQQLFQFGIVLAVPAIVGHARGIAQQIIRRPINHQRFWAFSEIEFDTAVLIASVSNFAVIFGATRLLAILPLGLAMTSDDDDDDDDDDGDDGEYRSRRELPPLRPNPRSQPRKRYRPRN